MSATDLHCTEFVELVTDYLEDALPAAERARFEAHLAFCEGCEAYLEQIRATILVAGRLPEEDLGTPEVDGLLTAFRAWREEREAG